MVKRSIYNPKLKRNITDEIYQFSIEGYILPSVYNELINLLTIKYNDYKKLKKEREEENTSPQKKDDGLYIEMITDSRTIGMNIFKVQPGKQNKSIKMEKDNNNNTQKEKEIESNTFSGDKIYSDLFLRQLLYYKNIYYYND